MRLLTTVLAASVLFLASCNKFEKTKSGFKYKITSAVSKEKIKNGDIVKYEEELKIDGKDTVLKSTYGEMPGFMPVDTSRMPKHYFTEIITKLGKGDKVEFVMSVDSLIKVQLLPGYDKQFKRGGTIKGKVEIVQVYKTDAEARADFEKEKTAYEQKMMKKMEKESSAKTAEEAKAIEKYVADKKLKTVKSPNGVLVAIENEGTGPKPDSGKVVSVLYRGYTMDGKVFDGNMDAGSRSKEPYPVTIGAHGVIPGWEEGLRFLGKGGKGKFIIPFKLAYGPQGSNGIAPYTTLVFDIEIADVKDAAPAPKDLGPMPQKGVDAVEGKNRPQQKQ